MTDTAGFFGTLGHLAGSVENQLSRTFAACFARSSDFRQRILVMLARVCHVNLHTRSSHEWTCTPEVAMKRGGRVDLCIGPGGRDGQYAHRQGRVFYLESKVEAPLTYGQLRRYREDKQGLAFLIAITKYPADVTARQLAKLGAFTLRWQDVHRELLGMNPSRPIDRFIVREFVKYLEDLGMAYREDIGLDDLKRVQKLLSTAASPQSDPRHELIPRNAFEVADSFFNMLYELRRSFTEQHPKFPLRRRWGPGYFVWFEDGVRWHAFGWDLFGRKYSEKCFGGRLWLSERAKDGLWWDVHLEGTKVQERSREWNVKDMLNRDGTLDRGKLLSSLATYARRWGLTS